MRFCFWIATPVAMLMGTWPITAHGQKDTDPPVITHTPVKQALQNKPLTISAKISDAHAIFAPAVYVRLERATDYDNIPMRPVGRTFQAVIPASRVTGRLEYFIEAFDVLGNGPARMGTPETPMRVEAVAKLPPVSLPPPVKASPPPPPILDPPPPAENNDDSEGGIFSQWWFWTAVGVVVAGAATGTALALQSSPDFVTVDVRGPDPTRDLP